MDMKTLSKCSLIISTYNWPEALRLCLLSVKLQSVLPNEVIVADDGSGHETADMIDSMRADFPVPILHVWHADNGFQLSRIRNKAIGNCSFAYIIQIDGDLVLHKHFIRDHLMVGKAGSFVAGSRVLMNQFLSEKLLHSQQTRISLFEKGLSNFCNQFSIAWLRNHMADRYRINDITALRGCNMAFWKDDVIDVNGYNEEFHSWGREDSELAIRLLNFGIKKRALKFGGVVYHIHHEEADKKGCLVNDQILSLAVENKSVYCIHGIDQHIVKNPNTLEKQYAHFGEQ